ncbi:2-phospho-L-lactate transferase [Saliphagus infecundisoli]|uniref:2-phospho-L-lactate transferase n=1 Tax=Saliphagus infecundisoli TaxID=1849069 RepID=A0ABD5QEQ5_9EURY|nr:2-phospho-L-lactate transferase [Saliphagus infecundisoli]
MVTVLSGGTGTPKLLEGTGSGRVDAAGGEGPFSSETLTIVANTGDDIELGGLLVSPDIDTLLFQGGDVLDREYWWGIEGDTHRTNEALFELASEAGLSEGPQYLPEEAQTAGRRLARWRRFSGIAEFMTIGDRDRAVHITRTSLIDRGETLTEATRVLGEAVGAESEILPMSDDPVATIVHTPEGAMHFQEYWVGREGEPTVEDVEFRGSEEAAPTDTVLEALTEPVVIGPSNPVTSVGPILSVPGVREALAETTVVTVSPFLAGEAFSGPAAELMRATGREPTTAGLAEAYPFADAVVVDSGDGGDLPVPTVETNIRIDGEADARRVREAALRAIERVREGDGNR